MASSILTNSSAMTALQTLTATQKALNTTQSQIASGLRVATASDNAAYWSMSSTLRSDTGALSAVSDALNLSTSILDVASTALAATMTALNRIKADFVTAQQPGTSLSNVQADILAQQKSLIAIISSASFNGVNLLDSASPSPMSFVTSFTRSSTGAVSIGTTTFGSTAQTTFSNGSAWSTKGLLNWQSIAGSSSGILGGGVLLGAGLSSAAAGSDGTNYKSGSLLAIDITSASMNDLKVLQSAIEPIMKTVSGFATQIATIQTTVASQQTFVQSLSDAITSGVGSLVDADMNVASTRLQALQTQQQLGIQALSIANQNSQLVLKLFGG